MTAKQDRRGGARPGAGRPKGSGNKVTVQDLIDQAQQTIGKPFVQSLIEGYHDTIIAGDRRTRVMYEKMIMDKVLADRQQVEVTDSADLVQARSDAFAAALRVVAVAAERDK
jgi:methionine salvage enolase-phosphatase E1